MKNVIKNKIAQFETKTSLRFPSELADYYLETDGETFENRAAHLVRKLNSGFEQGGFIEEIMPLDELIRLYFDIQDDETFTEGLKNAKLIPFGEIMGGALVCMASSPDPTLHGKIYVWDWDFRATYQADSLEEFLEQLHEYQEV
jgi:SMI1 / KNR4 family (SUKH-1)